MKRVKIRKGARNPKAATAIATAIVGRKKTSVSSPASNDKPRRRRGDPLLHAERPAAPEGAKWEVFTWNTSMCNWRHYAFARTKKECQRVASDIVALGGKVWFKKRAATSSGGRPAVEPQHDAARHGRDTGKSIGIQKAAKRPSTDSDAYRKASIASLVHWLDVAKRADLVYHMPHSEIRSLRDTCRRILERRISLRSPDFNDDPLRRWL